MLLLTDMSLFLNLQKIFRWTRPADMPSHEPSEGDIWAAIDAHDPHGVAEIDDRLEQHGDMLQGRDMYRDFFS